MRYDGPIYRPPSEANSLLVQATVGCPHNRCTFCLVYKNGPKYRVRAVDEIKEDMREAADDYGRQIRTLFFPAGNSIAMETDELADICLFAGKVFPNLERITVYGSSQYIYKKGPDEMKRLAEAGLSRIHVGLESGDDAILSRIKKGTDSRKHIDAGRFVMDAGMELSLYVILGIGGSERSASHARETARVLNLISPDFIRLRTFVPKKNTPLLQDVLNESFEMLGAHGVLKETADLVKQTTACSTLVSDHYTNYINVEGRLPEEKNRILEKIETALEKDENCFRAFFIGDQ
ncbi:MAG: B12-binding domain-containing radical SAM protein [Proteobacteria bacterium]|nr:B12-binding domain-containing radical SAM protein [Pseudomonadota bacterium]